MKTEDKKTAKKEDKVISLSKEEAKKRRQIRNKKPNIGEEKSTSSSKTP